MSRKILLSHKFFANTQGESTLIIEPNLFLEDSNAYSAEFGQLFRSKAATCSD